MTAIVDIKALEVLDSRGNPTVQAEVILESGCLFHTVDPEWRRYSQYATKRHILQVATRRYSDLNISQRGADSVVVGHSNDGRGRVL